MISIGIISYLANGQEIELFCGDHIVDELVQGEILKSYNFMVSGDKPVRAEFSTCNQTLDETFDTVIELFEDGSSITSVDDAECHNQNSVQSVLSYDLYPDREYQFELRGYSDDYYGSFELHVRCNELS